MSLRHHVGSSILSALSHFLKTTKSKMSNLNQDIKRPKNEEKMPRVKA